MCKAKIWQFSKSVFLLTFLLRLKNQSCLHLGSKLILPEGKDTVFGYAPPVCEANPPETEIVPGADL